MWLPVKNQNSGTRRYMSSHGSAMTAGSTVLLDSSPLREVGANPRSAQSRRPTKRCRQVRQSLSRRLQPSDLGFDRLKSPAPQLRTDHPWQRQPGPHHAFVPGRRPAPRGDGGARCRGAMAVAAGSILPMRKGTLKKGRSPLASACPAVILCGQRTRSFESNYGCGLSVSSQGSEPRRT